MSVVAAPRGGSSGFRGATIARDIRFSGASIAGKVQSAQITMTQGEHDEAVLKISGAGNVGYYGYVQDRLLSFIWGEGGEGRFYGYVTDVTSIRKTSTSGPLLQITAQGPTFIMKTGRPRFFTNVSVVDVAQRLCSEHQLGFNDEYGQRHYIWRQLAQTDESDWEFLNSLAKRIGAGLICTSGVVRLIDPMSALTRSAPLAFFSATPGDGSYDIYDMVPAHFSGRLPSQFSPTVSYLINGKVEVKGQNSPVTVPAVFSSARPILNQKEAAFAQIRMPVEWEEQATVRLQGDPRIEPGSVLMLKSGNRTVTNLPYDGYWYVISVLHALEQTAARYESRVDLARVTKAPRLKEISARQWFLNPRGRPELIPTPTGNWASTWR